MTYKNSLSNTEAIASLLMLGHKNIITEVGHHAPGFYSNVFLDTSLEAMGITNVQEMGDRNYLNQHRLLSGRYQNRPKGFPKGYIRRCIL
jgi:phosphoketolase